MKKLVFPVLSLLSLLLFSLTQASAASAVSDLPDAFYNRPGLEGMPRIAYSKMKVVNVRDCGAVGDGVSDERVAFEKAIRELQPDGGIVFVPKGRYYFKTPALPERVTWAPRIGLKDLENIHFVGEGDESAIVFRLPPTGIEQYIYGWKLGGFRNSSIRDLRFSVEPYLQMRTGPAIGLTPIALQDPVDHFQILRVTIDQGRMGFVCWGKGKNIWIVETDIRNTSADSIHFRNSNDCTIAYSYVENSGDDGIAPWRAPVDNMSDATSWSKNYRVYNNTVVGVRWGRGIPTSGDNVIVKGNWVERTIFSGMAAIDHGGGKTPPSQNVLFTDNTVVRCGLGVRSDNNLDGHGLGAQLLVATEVASVRATGNRFFSGQNEGIMLGSPFALNSTSIELDHNTLAGNLAAGINVYPRDPSVIGAVKIHDNVFAGNGKGAVLLTNIKGIKSIEPPDVASIQQSADEQAPLDPYEQVRKATDETKWDLPELSDISKLPVISLKDHGVSGDGKTNDLPALMKAIAAAPSGGAVIRFPAGTFRLEPLPEKSSSPETAIRHHLLLQNAKNLHFVGEGSSTTLLFTNRDYEGIRYLNAENCSILNMQLKQENPPAYRRGRAFVAVSASEGICLQGLTMTRSSGSSLWLDCSRKIKVTDCTIDSAGEHGIKIVGARQVEIANCRILKPRDAGVLTHWQGGICREPQFIRIQGNQIEDSEQSSGIAVASGMAVEILKNRIKRPALAGVMVNEQARVFNPRNVTIADNEIDQACANDFCYVKGAISIFKCSGGKVSRTEIAVLGNRVTNSKLADIWISKNKGKLSPFALQSVAIEGNKFSSGAGPRVIIEDSAINKLVIQNNTTETKDWLEMNEAQRKAIPDIKMQ